MNNSDRREQRRIQTIRKFLKKTSHDTCHKLAHSLIPGSLTVPRLWTGCLSSDEALLCAYLAVAETDEDGYARVDREMLANELLFFHPDNLELALMRLHDRAVINDPRFGDFGAEVQFDPEQLARLVRSVALDIQ